MILGWFIRGVRFKDIDVALQTIHISKVPGLDGWNSFFFKEVCHIVRSNIYDDVLKFFSTSKMCPQVNVTCITLIPKSASADKVALFRPISCCFILYKLIAKVLSFKLREVMGSIINQGQVGFILECNCQVMFFRPHRSLKVW